MVKAALKEAREYIRTKKFENAIRMCEGILRQDPKNYMAFVYLGAAHQDRNKNEAAKHLRKAITLSEDPTLAYQGLLNCTEGEELIEVVKNLLKLLPDKAIEYHNKIMSMKKSENILEKCIDIFESEHNLEKNEQNQERINSALLCLNKLFMQMANIPDKWNNLFEASLEYTYCQKLEQHMDVSGRYIKHLYKLKKLEKLLNVADEMIESYPNEVYPLEWICKAYIENYEREDLKFSDYLKNDIHFYTDKLLSLNELSHLGNFVKAIDCFNNGQYIQSRNFIVKIEDKLPNLPLYIEFLVKIYMTIGSFQLAVNNLKKINKKNIALIKSLTLSNNEKNWKDAISLYNEINSQLNEKDRNQGKLYAARSYFCLKEKELGEKLLKELQNTNLDEEAKLLEIEFLSTPQDSISILTNMNQRTFEEDLLLSKKYFECEMYEEALMASLRATKLKQYYAECFFQLGKIYFTINKTEDNWTRAKKCLEKYTNLVPFNEEGVILLSSIYRRNEEWENNHTLLQSIIKYFPEKPKWVYFQLGLHFLIIKNFSKAISSFRSALRCENNDIFSLEGLADAYHQRGSYSSALKVFQKITELDTKNCYSKLQVANIKNTLHMFQEAISDFELLLKEYSDYIPALKGIAEAYYGLSIYSLSRNLLGRCKDHLQSATNYLQKIFLLGVRNAVWLWRFLATIFVKTGCLPKSLAFLEVCGTLAVREENIIVLERDELFEFASRFYTCAIKQRENDAFLWYELGNCYYHYSSKSQNEDKKKKYMDLAFEVCQNTIRLDPERWQNWNQFGVICVSKDVNDLALAQHCFISALQLNKKSAITWTNLGVLYLKENELKLANKAFTRAQQFDTEYINAWIGQAIIAEKIGQDDESMDLFRHCTQLEFHVEAAIGYAYWITAIMSKSDFLLEPRYRYFIENMNALPVALDCMNWYFKFEEEDSSIEALSYLGFLSAKQSLWKLAIKAFSLAANKASGNEKDMMLCNLGFMYIKNSEISKAIDAFNSVNEATYKSTIGLALARFLAAEYKESYTVYSSAYEWLANNASEQAQVLIAMAGMIYEFEGEENAKTLLLQCIESSNPPIQGLFSACALGILHKNFELLDAIMDELNVYKSDPNNIHHVVFLTAQTLKANDEIKSGYLYILSQIHIYPENTLLRQILVSYLKENFTKSKKHIIGLSHMAQAAVVLAQKEKKLKSSLEAANLLSIASTAMSTINRQTCLKLAQRAIHINPSSKVAWKILLSNSH